jgi:hypothetical protein
MTETHLHTIKAAEGWLELGDPANALKELGRLPSSACDVRVMELRYTAFTVGQQWPAAEMVAQVARDLYPNEPGPLLWWIDARFQATGDARAAHAMLKQVAMRFPNDRGVAEALKVFDQQEHRR